MESVELTVGSQVVVRLEDSDSLCGTIRWIGTLPGHDGVYTGVGLVSRTFLAHFTLFTIIWKILNRYQTKLVSFYLLMHLRYYNFDFLDLPLLTINCYSVIIFKLIDLNLDRRLY